MILLKYLCPSSHIFRDPNRASPTFTVDMERQVQQDDIGGSDGEEADSDGSVPSSERAFWDELAALNKTHTEVRSTLPNP